MAQSGKSRKSPKKARKKSSRRGVSAPKKHKPICLFVLGMHRSGTSALTRLLSLCGADLPKKLMGQGVKIGNIKGHWEPDIIVAHNDKLLAALGSAWNDWRKLDFHKLSPVQREDFQTGILNQIQADFGASPLFVLKDPRICRMADFYLKTVQKGGYDARFILPLRNPLEVWGSLNRRNGYTPTVSGLIWLRHILDAEYTTRGLPRTFTLYEDMFTNWQEMCRKIESDLSIKWPFNLNEIDRLVEDFLSPELRHHRATVEDLQFNANFQYWITETYVTSQMLVKNPNSRAAMKKLDAIREEFDALSPILHQFLSSEEALYVDQATRLQAEIAEKNKQIETLSARTSVAPVAVKPNTPKAGVKTSSRAPSESTLQETAPAEVIKERELLLKKVDQLEGEAGQLAHTLESHGQEMAALKQEAQSLNEQNEQAQEQIKDLKMTLQQEKARAEIFHEELQEAKSFSDDTLMVLGKKEESLSQARALIEEKTEEAARLDQQLQNLAKERDAITQEATRSREENEKILSQLAQKEEAYLQMQTAMENKSSEAELLQQQGRSGNKAQDEIQSQMALSRKANEEALVVLGQKEQTLEGKLFELQQAMNALHAQNEITEAMKQSHSWRLTKPLRFAANVARVMKRRLGFSGSVPPVPVVHPEVHPAEHSAEHIEEPSSRLEEVFDAGAPQSSSVSKAPITPSAKTPEDIQPLSATGKLTGNTDYIVVRDGAIFGWGWVFCDVCEIVQVLLEVTTKTGKVSRIGVSHGALREDIEKAFPDVAHASKSGYTAYGAWNGEPLTKAELRAVLPDGSSLTLPIRFDNLDENEKPKRRALISQQNIRKGADLLLRGQWTQLKERVESYSVETSRTLTPENAVQLREHIIEMDPTGMVLLLDHAMGGGANVYSKQKISRLQEQNRCIMLVDYDLKALKYRALLKVPGRPDFSFGFYKIHELLVLLTDDLIAEIIINDLVSYPKPERVMEYLTNFTRKTGVPIKVAVHDHYACCPSHFLLDISGRFCNIPDPEMCKTCLPGNPHGFTSLSQSQDITVWRQHWNDLLLTATEIVFFSEATKKTVLKAHPNLDPAVLKVEPHAHDVSFNGKAEIDLNADLCIGVIGAITFHKGSHIIRDLSHEIERRGVPIKIRIIGQFDSDAADDVISVTGPYKTEDLPGLVNASGANVFLLPSIVPETFSYVTDEMIQMNLPVLCFNLGAPGERVAEYHRGKVVEQSTAAALLDDLITFHRQLRDGENL